MKHDFLAAVSGGFNLSPVQHDSVFPSPAETLTADLYGLVSLRRRGIASSQFEPMFAAELIACLSGLCVCLPLVDVHVTEQQNSLFATPPPVLSPSLFLHLFPWVTQIRSGMKELKRASAIPAMLPASWNIQGIILEKKKKKKTQSGTRMFAMQIIKEEALLLFTMLYYVFVSVRSSVSVPSMVSSHLACYFPMLGS